MVSQFGGSPGILYLEAAKRILRYLKGTMEYGLMLGCHGVEGFDLVGWTDSNWVQDPDDHRSVGGFIFEIAGSTVTWSSRKQSTVATSSAEEEYMALANATKEAVWLRTLLKEMDFPQISATIIFADNQGCIALTRNPVNHSHAKHIDIRHHFIRERVGMGEIDLRYISTKNMLADGFTKQLPREAFEKFRSHLGVVPLT